MIPVASQPLLEARGLCAGYGERVVVGTSTLSVSAGKLLVVLGPNGCCKTTTLKTCIGLLPALYGKFVLPVSRKKRKVD
jgi:ABC-type cobalamin/Fe3+-siderophores transport system ATPase subunit